MVKKTLLTNLEVNKTHKIDYYTAKFQNYKKQSATNYIKNVTKDIGLNYIHKENEFDDYQRELLLPHKFISRRPIYGCSRC